jgi:hypothetical protein
MKTIARYWEEKFDDLIRDGRSGQYKQRLEWFLFRLHLAVQTVETQSDGSKLLIFEDGSAYGEESDLDALLQPACRRKSEAARFTPASKKRERCRKGQRHVTSRIQLRR